jgi:hypothetical protein
LTQNPNDQNLDFEWWEKIWKTGGAQRKAYAAEVGRLIAKLQEKRQSANGDVHWFVEMAKNSNTPERTLLNWWSAFCKDVDLALTPKQALQLHQEQFYAWLTAQQAHAEAEHAALRWVVSCVVGGASTRGTLALP